MKASQFSMFKKMCEDRCRITRHSEGSISPWSTEEEDSEREEVIYDGICDCQVPANIRTFSGNGVIKKDMAIYIPARVEVMEGDKIEIIPKYNKPWSFVTVSKGITKDELTTINVNIPIN